MNPETLIAEYLAAYEAANGKPAPNLSYERGWFRISHGTYYGTRHRRIEIEKMRDRLLEHKS